jgi:hypothetical protein
MSKTISIDAVEPESILAEPVTNSLGQTLINSGVTLTSKHISLLRTWNIQIVKIIDGSNDEVNNINEYQISQARIELKKYVRWTPRNNAEEDLIELGVLALAHKMKEMSND